MSARSYLSIGDVLSLLREEFPDVTISKIRFLESQGLVDPERSPSGYRKFYERDVERLRWVLRQQREHFLPLKVIRDRLAAAGNGVPPDEPEESDRGPVPAVFESPWEPGPGELETAPGGAGAVTTVAERGPAAREAVVEGNGAGVEWPRYETGADARQGVSGTDSTPATLRAVPATGEPVGTVRAASSGAARGPVAGAHTVSGGTVTFDALASGATAGVQAAGATAGAQAAGATAGVQAAGAQAAGATSGAQAAGVPTAAGATAGAHSELDTTGPVAAPAHEPDVAFGGTGVRADPPADPHGAGRPAAAAPSDESPGEPGPGSLPATRSPRAAERRAGGATPIGTAAAALAGPVSGVSLTLQELCAATGLTPGDISALEGFGLIAPMAVAGGVYFDEEALTVAKLVVEFGRYGIEPRHLRLYRNAVEREVGLVEQVVTPLLRQRNPEARQRAIESASELVRLGQSLRSSLVRTSLRRQLGG